MSTTDETLHRSRSAQAAERERRGLVKFQVTAPIESKQRVLELCAKLRRIKAEHLAAAERDATATPAEGPSTEERTPCDPEPKPGTAARPEPPTGDSPS